MPSEFGKSKPRSYVKASDLKTGDKILFIDGGKWVEKDFSKLQDKSELKTVFVAKVSVNSGDPKDLTINGTSGGSLARTWGSEANNNWASRYCTVSFLTMPVFGKMQDVLMLIPTDEKAQW